jgi:hypothetical protein
MMARRDGTHRGVWEQKRSSSLENASVSRHANADEGGFAFVSKARVNAALHLPETAITIGNQ